eukprot:2938556-Prymnesium_polylepis.1
MLVDNVGTRKLESASPRTLCLLPVRALATASRGRCIASQAAAEVLYASKYVRAKYALPEIRC